MPPGPSLYDSHMPSVFSHQPQSQVNVQEQDPIHWSFKGAPGFLADNFLLWVDTVPADFYCQKLFRILFPGLVLSVDLSQS